MNKRIAAFACTAVLAGASAVSAQVGGGVKVGVNVANVSIREGGTTASQGNREALLAGVFLHIPIVRHVAVQPEVLFDMKGATAPAGFPSQGVVRFTSLDFPVLLRVDVPSGGAIVPYGYAGPAVEFLLRAKAESTLSGTVREENVKGDMKSAEFSIVAGGGVRFGRFLAEARYTRGLTNVLTDLASRGSAKLTNHAIALIGGMRF